MHSNKDCILLLGMVHSSYDKFKRGQEIRDKIRCESLISMGFKIRTIDDKHSDAHIQNHCKCNFNDPRRLLLSVKKKWGDEGKIQYRHIILDYFFSPVSTIVKDINMNPIVLYLV